MLITVRIFAIYLHAPTLPWQASAHGRELVPLACCQCLLIHTALHSSRRAPLKPVEREYWPTPPRTLCSRRPFLLLCLVDWSY